MKYIVVYEEDGNGWKASVPDLPGCIAQGATREEVEAKMPELIALYIEALQSEGQEIPESHARAGEIDSLK